MKLQLIGCTVGKDNRPILESDIPEALRQYVVIDSGDGNSSTGSAAIASSSSSAPPSTALARRGTGTGNVNGKKDGKSEDNDEPPKREDMIPALQKDVCSDARLMGEFRSIRSHLRVLAFKVKVFDEGLVDRFDEAFPETGSGLAVNGNGIQNHSGGSNSKKKKKKKSKNPPSSSNAAFNSTSDSSFSPDEETTRMYATLILDFYQAVEKWKKSDDFKKIERNLPRRTKVALGEYDRMIPAFYEASKRSVKLQITVDRHNAMRSAAGLDGGEPLPPRTDPDIPPCDNCSKKFAGTLICGRCESAFYCGADCQRSHWKKCHKKECDVMRDNCKKTGREVVEFLNLEPPTTAELGRWTDKLGAQLHRLDAGGPYKEAVRSGLYDALRAKMQHKKKEVNLYVTEPFMTILFCGERVEGKAEGMAFCSSTMDGSRIKGYVKSSPDAFDIWFDATLGRLELLLYPRLELGSNEHLYTHEAAARVWNGWTFVFQSQKAAKAILLPKVEARGSASLYTVAGSKGGDKNDGPTLRRCRSIVESLRKWSKDIWEGGEERDPCRKIDFHLMVVCAMVSHWLKVYEVPLDLSPEALGLGGTRLDAYLTSVVPMAEDRIRKGSSLKT